MIKMLKPSLNMHRPERVAVEHRNASATKRTRGGAWMNIRIAYLKQNPLCVMCDSVGVVTAAAELDHVIPLSLGGSDAASNYQALCKQCHAIKTAGEAKVRGRGY